MRLGDGAVQRGERTVSDNVPVLLPSLPNRMVRDVVGVEAESVGCPELPCALCMVLTGRSTHLRT